MLLRWRGLALLLLQVGSSLTLADVSVLCAALPLFRSVLGADARAAYPATCAWLASSSGGNPHFSRVLGECAGMHAGAGSCRQRQQGLAAAC